jgi:hypothetical protein
VAVVLRVRLVRLLQLARLVLLVPPSVVELVVEAVDLRSRLLLLALRAVLVVKVVAAAEAVGLE